jgi:hypothetical protein
MTTLTYLKPERLWLRDHPHFTERWLQDRIAADPSLLGLGDLVLKDRERIHTRAGRLDLLLQEVEGTRRYEVELQLGKTDEAHVIRAVEYWDIERKRYPQYDHVAVIVAEDITSRFLNVIGLFNGVIPLVAIQLHALKLGDHISVVCTKVLDEARLGLVDEDEEVQAVTNRAYWEARATKDTMAMMDDLFVMLKQLDPALELKYNKFYVGLAKNGQPSNFVVFRPQKEWVRVEIGLEKTDETTKRLEDAGLDVMDYEARWRKYRIRLAKGDIAQHRDLLRDLLRQAYE